MSSRDTAAAAAVGTSDHFELEPIKAKSGLWTARLWYVTRQGRKKNYVCSVVLRARKHGHIIIDYGSRESGARKSLGTSDYQKAVQGEHWREDRTGQTENLRRQWWTEPVDGAISLGSRLQGSKRYDELLRFRANELDVLIGMLEDLRTNRDGR